MRRFCRLSSVLRLGLLTLPVMVSLVGCAHSAHPPLTTAPIPTTAAGVEAVQDSPSYRDAVRLYARHDYRGALARLDALAGQPRLTRDAAAQDFLAYQRLLCRHALDPRVVVQPPMPVPPVDVHIIRQADCGPRSLLLLCRKEKVQTTLPDLRRQAGTTARGTTLAGLARAARAHGFRPAGVQMDPQALANLSHPAIAWVDGDHYLAVLSVEDGQATIHDPNRSGEEVMPVNQLWSRCGGVLLTLAR